MSPRALVVADSDSYVKWAAALADTLPASWETRLVVLEADRAPSDRQVSDAVAGTTWADRTIPRVGPRALRRQLGDVDVLVLGVRGHAVPWITRWLRDRPRRPVILSGAAGLTVPAQWYDVHQRRGADLLIVHSRRERREVTTLAAERDVPVRAAVATLPFLSTVPSGDPRGPIVFAPQALVPAEDDDRRRLLVALGTLARRRPVIVKVRALAGEHETHRGATPYPDLASDLDLPTTLSFADGPMADHLATASGLITVGSTAALEATAAGVPSLVLSEFDGEPGLFTASGLEGTLDDVADGRLRTASPTWAADHGLHPASEDDWLSAATDLLTVRERAGLPSPSPLRRRGRERAYGVYHRHDALRPWRGTPLRWLETLLLRAAHLLNRRLLHVS